MSSISGDGYIKKTKQKNDHWTYKDEKQKLLL